MNDHCGEKGDVSTQDRKLCSNPMIWKNVSCHMHYPDGMVGSYSRRCTGRNMQCVQAWYMADDGGETIGELTETCSDMSDQTFTGGLTCRQHLQEHIDFHNMHFCNSTMKYNVSSELICRNKTKWLEEQDKSFQDPHKCQDSCSIPGPDCVACTNPDYFKCSNSLTCLHPDLVCDGHPQCPERDDENLKKCHQHYINNGLLEPFASFECKSLLYKEMDIYATPCNNRTECLNETDEKDCENNNLMITLFVSLLMILVLYLSVEIYYICSTKGPEHIEVVTGLRPSGKQVMESYEINHSDSDIIEKVNTFYLFKIWSEHSITVTNEYLKLLDLEMRVHGENKSEVYRCLKNNLDPLIIDKIFSAKNPGIIAWFKKILFRLSEKHHFRLKGLRKAKLFATILMIELKYFDQVKDTALTLLIIYLVGDLESVVNVPNNFSSVVVIIMLVSIVVPFLMSSLHLSVNNPFMILPNKGYSWLTKSYMRITCLLISWINPILLRTKLDQARKLVTQLAKYYHPDVTKSIEKCRSIDIQLAKFHKIEIGRFSF